MRFNLVDDRGTYRCRFSHKNSRRTFTLGTTDPGTAERMIKQAERDWLDGEFDWTFERYNAKLRKQQQPESNKQLSKTDLRSLYGQFKALKVHILSHQSIGDYHQLGSRFLSIATLKPDEKFWKVILAGQSGKKMGCLLNAFGNWCVERGYLKQNPYAEYKRYLVLNSRGSKDTDESHVDPFTDDEVKAIKSYFPVGTPKWRLVNLLFALGCRPGEVLGLKRSDLKGDRLTLQRVKCRDGTYEEGLKTQAKRVLKVSDQVRGIIEMTHGDAHLFPMINWGNFSRRDWKRCLADLGIRYRNPYQIRHTVITRWIAQGMSSDIVAKFCGNSPEMIHKHYLGDDLGIELPS